MYLLPRVQAARGQRALHGALRGGARRAGRPGPGAEGGAKVGELDRVGVPDRPPRGHVLGGQRRHARAHSRADDQSRRRRAHEPRAVRAGVHRGPPARAIRHMARMGFGILQPRPASPGPCMQSPAVTLELSVRGDGPQEAQLQCIGRCQGCSICDLVEVVLPTMCPVSTASMCRASARSSAVHKGGMLGALQGHHGTWHGAELRTWVT